MSTEVVVDKNKQRILAIDRLKLFGCFIQYTFNGFVREQLFCRQMQGLNCYINTPIQIAQLFQERGPLEKDPGYKQIIPYVVVGSSINKTFLSYQRPSKGDGEHRLQGKYSIGFGGHIEEQDMVNACTLSDVIINCAKREVKEELSLWADGLKFEVLGYINDDTDDVGKVHFGVVLYLDISKVPTEDVLKMLTNNSEVECLNFRTLDDLKHIENLYGFESWSQHLIHSLEYIILT